MIDLGKVIAEGTSDQLKDQIGGEVLELKVENTSQTAEARAEALRGLGTGEPERRRRRGPHPAARRQEGAAALRDSSRRLDERQIRLAGFAVHRADVGRRVHGAHRPRAPRMAPEPEQNGGKRKRGRKKANA